MNDSWVMGYGTNQDPYVYFFQDQETLERKVRTQ